MPPYFFREIPMKEIPIITLWMEGGVFHGIECNGKAAILALDSDVDGVEDQDLTTVSFHPFDKVNYKRPDRTFYVVLLMDDLHHVIGGDEVLSLDEIKARARAQVDDWKNMT